MKTNPVSPLAPGAFPRFFSRAGAWLAVVLGLSVSTPVALAQAVGLTNTPPEYMTYQGYLTDANGIPLATNQPTNFQVTFRVWNDPNSANLNNLIWGEVQVVTVSQGNFSVLLGQGQPNGSDSHTNLSSIFNQPDASARYIELTVALNNNTSSTLSPRLRLVPTAYAFLARHSIDASGIMTPGGNFIGGTDLATLDGNNTFSQSLRVEGQIDVGQSLIVHGGANVLGPEDVGGTLSAHGDLIVSGIATLNQALNVAQKGTFKNGEQVSGGLSADQLTVHGNATVGGTLNVGTLALGGNAIVTSSQGSLQILAGQYKGNRAVNVSGGITITPTTYTAVGGVFIFGTFIPTGQTYTSIGAPYTVSLAVGSNPIVVVTPYASVSPFVNQTGPSLFVVHLNGEGGYPSQAEGAPVPVPDAPFSLIALSLP